MLLPASRSTREQTLLLDSWALSPLIPLPHHPCADSGLILFPSWAGAPGVGHGAPGVTNACPRPGL